MPSAMRDPGISKERCPWIGGLAGLLGLLLLFSGVGQAGQWRNPQEVIGNPTLTRLQQGRKELSPGEKEDLQKYGYTGLEVMTYLDDNLDPGGLDADTFRRTVRISTAGLIQSEIWLIKIKYSYRDYKALLIYDRIRPGEVKDKIAGVNLFPPKDRGSAGFSHIYLRSKNFHKREEGLVYLESLRRARRFTPADPQDSWSGTVLSWDDFRWREPWEEDHRILGEDTLRGSPCLVIESRHLDPHYYLSKRITWVERTHFTDLHEEQFDRQGRLWKIADKGWEQVAPWGYWAKRYDYWTDLLSGQSSVVEYFDWRFDLGFKDEEFTESALIKGFGPWREPQRPLLPIKDLSELPPKPQVRWELWQARKDRP